MAVLRCPKCGKTVKQSDEYCPKCGEHIDKPVVDTIASNEQEGLLICLKGLAILVLFIIIGEVINALFYPPLMVSLVCAGIITVLIILLIKRLGNE